MPWKKIKNIFEKTRQELVLDENEIEEENRIVAREGEQKFTSRPLRIAVKLGLFLVLFLSMMPIIGFYGGLLGLFLFVGLIYYLKKNKIAWKSPYNRYRRGWIRLAFYAVLFGLVAHTSCKIHSSLLIADFRQECREEKGNLLPDSP